MSFFEDDSLVAGGSSSSGAMCDDAEMAWMEVMVNNYSRFTDLSASEKDDLRSLFGLGWIMKENHDNRARPRWWRRWI